MSADPNSSSPHHAKGGKEGPLRIGRRLFLGLLGAGAVALFVPRNLVSNLFSGTRLDQPLGTEEVVTGAFTRFIGRLSPSEIPTPRGRFRIYQVTQNIPQFDPSTWRLQVDGLVDNPVSLTFDQLLALPSDTQISDFKCVTGWEVKEIYWEGVRFSTILDMVKPRPEATHITFYSTDGAYTDSLSLQQAAYPEVMLAYNMAGKPLPARQGAPLRVTVPRMFGYKGTKWLGRMELTNRQIRGYWEVRGYAVDAYRS